MSAAFLVLATILPAGRPDAASFQEEVRPLLARRCFSCHGPDTAESGLDLSDRGSTTGQADSGEVAVVAGDLHASELLRRIRSTDEGDRMPPEGKPLNEEEIALLERWVAGGAEYERHWSFEPVREVEPPEVAAADWVRNPVDRFVLKKLEDSGLSPAPEAPPAVLLRRLSQDLVGLPPTPDETRAFVAASAVDSEAAYAAKVDELLDSRHHGERWARHWLDVVRFAETNSYERDGEKPNAWKYREWVINSLNEDKPYDRFVIEQVAGDELPAPTVETLTGTGFLRLGTWDDEPADKELNLFDQYDDIVTTVGQGMLGLTLNCARCHDHKIDPIPAADYYGFVAFFRGLPEYATRNDAYAHSQIEVTPDDVRAEHERIDKAVRKIKKKMASIEEAGIQKMPGPDQRKAETRQRPKVLKKLEMFLEPAQWREYQQLVARKDALESERDALPKRTHVLGVDQKEAVPPETHVLLRGSPHHEGEVVEPHFPELFETAAPELRPADEDAPSSGRRLALAKWVASPDNRLTSRVMVNRIWQHHFGRGLVRSPNNFGQLGNLPTHPDLLDWLATAFVRGGWSMKAMHRVMVMSSTYRMSTAFDGVAHDIDPTNDLFWRRDVRRMDAEELRDAALFTTGELNLERVGGRSIYPELSAEVLAGQSRPGEGWGKSTERERARRSLYIFSKRSLKVPVLAAFDFPDSDATCEARFQTVQPAQALALLNGDFLGERARRFAARLRSEVGDDVEAQVRRAYQLAVCRDATDEEVAEGVALIESLTTAPNPDRLSPDEAREMFSLTVFNLSEFAFID